jgi:hypothetical protein
MSTTRSTRRPVGATYYLGRTAVMWRTAHVVARRLHLTSDYRTSRKKALTSSTNMSGRSKAAK